MSESINDILYKDSEGEYVGLDEVQLLEPYPIERVKPLINLLSNTDNSIALEAALILSAWGIKDGIDYLEKFIDQKNEADGFFLHRIHGEDNVYDEIAHAIQLYFFSTKNYKRTLIILRKILELYGYFYFESYISHILFENEISKQLLMQIDNAIDIAIKENRLFQSSQLLPAYIKWGGQNYRSYIELYFKSFNTFPSPLINVAKALPFLSQEECNYFTHRLQPFRDNELINELVREIEN